MQFEEQVLIDSNTNKEKQKEATVRCQLLLDSVDNQLELVSRYILKLNETLLCAAADGADGADGGKQEELEKLKEDLGELNDDAAVGLKPFNLQCKIVRKKEKNENLNVGYVFDICMKKVEEFEEKAAKDIGQICNGNDKIMSQCMDALKPFTKCMKLAINGKKIPQIPLFDDVRFDQQVASQGFTNLMYHMNHTIANKVQNIEENEEKFRKKHERMKKETERYNNNNNNNKHGRNKNKNKNKNENMIVTTDQLFSHSLSSKKVNNMSKKQQQDRFEREKQRDAFKSPNLLGEWDESFNHHQTQHQYDHGHDRYHGANDHGSNDSHHSVQHTQNTHVQAPYHAFGGSFPMYASQTSQYQLHVNLLHGNYSINDNNNSSYRSNYMNFSPFGSAYKDYSE